MSSNPAPRKLAPWNLHGRLRKHLPTHIRDVDNGQLCDPIEVFSRNPKLKEPNNPKESFDAKVLGYESVNRGLDRSCFVKPQLKDVAQLTQSTLKRDDQNRPGSAKSQHRQDHNGAPTGRKGYPRHVSPPDVRGVRHSRYNYSLVPDLVNQRNHSTSPPPPHNFAVSRYLPGAKIHHYQHLPRPIRHAKSARNPKIRTDYPWRARSKSKPRETPGGTTIEELEKYIATSGTRLDPKPKQPTASGRRKTIEELKQYLVTSESFEISRAQKSTAAGNVPRTPGPPNVTPKASFEYTDTSNHQFETAYASTPKIDDSLTKVDIDIDKMQPAAGVMVDHLQALKKLLCTDVQKVENSSQFTEEGMVPVGVATSENMWQIVESVGDVAKLLDEDTMTDDPVNEPKPGPRSVVVSEKPRVKVIAEKFSKYKKNNIELRTLEEKIVCLEYDVYGKEGGSKFAMDQKATQVLRAYFSVKPNCKHGDGKGCNRDIEFTKLKKHFESESHDDIKKFEGKEIEIIDGSLEENHCYIQDLVKVLSNKKVIETKKNKTALDVMSLYDMAKTQRVIEEEDIHFLNQSQLAEVMKLIMKTCESNTNANNRRKLCYQGDKPSAEEVLNVSKSIINELYRESRKL